MITRLQSRRRSFLGVEPLEHRLLLSITINMDPILDEYGAQVETVQAYGNTTQTALSIFDSGASPIAFSTDDQSSFSTPLPVKVPDGAMASGLGGTIVGDVSQPGTILADGFHAARLIFDSFGFPYFQIHFTAATAQTPGVQAFIGTDAGSPILPTLTGMPILHPSSLNPKGLAARIDWQGYGLDLGLGETVGIPDIHFVAPTTHLSSRTVDTATVRINLGTFGVDNFQAPGSDITAAKNATVPTVRLDNAGTTLRQQRFLLDTGAQVTCISTAVANELGLDLSNPELSVAVQGAAGEEDDIPGFILDDLQIPLVGGGTLTYRNVPVFVLDVDPTINGILGTNLWNLADSMLFNPFDPTGSSLAVNFYKDPSMDSGGGVAGLFALQDGYQVGAAGSGLAHGQALAHTQFTLAQLLGGISREIGLTVGQSGLETQAIPSTSLAVLGSLPRNESDQSASGLMQLSIHLTAFAPGLGPNASAGLTAETARVPSSYSAGTAVSLVGSLPRATLEQGPTSGAIEEARSFGDESSNGTRIEPSSQWQDSELGTVVDSLEAQVLPSSIRSESVDAYWTSNPSIGDHPLPYLPESNDSALPAAGNDDLTPAITVLGLAYLLGECRNSPARVHQRSGGAQDRPR
jgi:hypothetical protein